MNKLAHRVTTPEDALEAVHQFIQEADELSKKVPETPASATTES